MHFSTAPSLLVGLGARLLLDKFTRSEEPSFVDFLVTGVWQGVGLYYAFTKSYELACGVALVIAGKIFIDFNGTPDATRLACTLIGVALGVLGTDVLSHFLDTGLARGQGSKARTHNGHGHASHPRERLVQFRGTVASDSSQRAKERAFRQTVSDITSIDSSSDLIRAKESMSPLDREVAALRARASLADSERRRFKEEKKWAKEQGNVARAQQMRWQQKRYTALMQSFHREADARLIEADKQRAQQSTEGRSAPATRQRVNSNRDDDRRIVSVDIGQGSRQQSVNMKSAVRVRVGS